MKKAVTSVLSAFNLQPVLVDIGASGTPPRVWEPIARHSVYIGFDPDRRELHDTPRGVYARSIIVNQAVTTEPDQDEVHFYLTRCPYCSSTLPPDTEALANYLFSDLFRVERETSVPASSLNSVIHRLGFPGVDWFKTDSQGTDLRLFQSLEDGVRNRVLAVDIEPGLIDAYRGEDLFVDAHRELLHQGFWLSSLDVKGAIRMRPPTLATLFRDQPSLREADIAQSIRSSPCWCEARYLRTIESLQARNAEEKDYALLWVFALLDGQSGFALDLAHEYHSTFHKTDISDILRELSVKAIQDCNNRPTWTRIKAFFPVSVKQFIKRLL